MTKGVAIACVVAFASGAAVGILAKPAKVVTHTETVTVHDKVEVAAKSDVTASSEQVTWKERIVYKPGGVTVVTRETAKADEKRVEKKVETKSVDYNHVTTIHDKVIESARPSWAADAFVGLGLDGARHAGGGLERRLFGGLWATAKVDVVSKAGLIGLRMEF